VPQAHWPTPRTRLLLSLKLALHASCRVSVAACAAALLGLVIIADACSADDSPVLDQKHVLVGADANQSEQHPLLKYLLTWSNKGNDAETAEDADKPLESDRPTFSVGPSTIGRGRFQLESSYTYQQAVDGDPHKASHHLPELLLSYGLAERLDFRFVFLLSCPSLEGGNLLHFFLS
jgi:hypothetical protein